MLTPSTQIEIGNYRFKGCKAFEINRDVNKISATGFIELPRLIAVKTDSSTTKVDLNKQLKYGDKVKIVTGYLEAENKIQSIFEGYVRNINTKNVVRIDVEDAMYLLRKKPVVISKKDVQLKDILKELVSGIKLPDGSDLKLSDKCNDLKLDTFNYKGSAHGAFNKIKEQLRMTIYIDDLNQLYCGLQQTNKREMIKATYGKNVIKNNISYQTKDTNPLQVKVVGKKKDNTEVSVIKGMDGGSLHTIQRYNVSDKAVLEQVAEEYLKSHSYDGFRGDITLFFLPFAQLGGSVLYKNDNYALPEGEYFIKAIKYKGGKGLRQVVKLGEKLR